MEELTAKLREITESTVTAIEALTDDLRVSRDREQQAAKVALEAMEAGNKYEALERVVNSPEVEDFMRGVKLEAAHQVLRWGEDHDRSKSAEHWLFLVGYLASKACRAQIEGDRTQALHHTISSAAALAHWHAFIRNDDSCIGLGRDEDLAEICDKFGLGLRSTYHCYSVGDTRDLYVARHVESLTEWMVEHQPERVNDSIVELSVMEKVLEGPESTRECTILEALVTRLLTGDVPPFLLATRLPA